MISIQNIIFDFGGVILEIDYQATIRAFRMLGISQFEDEYSQLRQSHLFDDFEKGLISAATFRDGIRRISGFPLTDREIDDAWNAILISFPDESKRFLDEIKKKYRIFLLSNTNAIHEAAFTKMITDKFGEDILKKSFDGIYFSHHMKMRKPDPAIFSQVLKENNLRPEKTLFVDDSFQHIEGAKLAGLHTFYFEKGKVLDDILKG